MNPENDAWSPRSVCARCRRPSSVCYCAAIVPLPTRTRVVLLQHPRERDMPIGSAHMASLALPNSELHVGVHFDDSPAVARATSDPSRPAILLYPGPGACDVAIDPPPGPGPVTLVAFDGTWSQTKTLLRHNPKLASLPRYAFVAPSPSEYRIRREPDAAYLSTIESLAFVLGILEARGAESTIGDRRFDDLLLPFRAMIDAQIRAERERGTRRYRKPRASGAAGRPAKPRLPGGLRVSDDRLVCVVGEANAWPYRGEDDPDHPPDEIVHWVALRLGTGEVLDVVATPDQPLSPTTPGHVELPESVLRAGVTRDAMHRAFEAFVRDDDVICSWGRYATSLFVSEGGRLPLARVDLRDVARTVEKAKVGTIEAYAARIDADVERGALLAGGRGGARLRATAAITRFLARSARAEGNPAGGAPGG